MVYNKYSDIENTKGLKKKLGSLVGRLALPLIKAYM
jgi:hypothetical protein